MFIVPFQLWLKNPITYKRNFIVVLTLFTAEILRSFTMTAQTTTLRQKKKMETENMEKAKNIDLIQL